MRNIASQGDQESSATATHTCPSGAHERLNHHIEAFTDPQMEPGPAGRTAGALR